jgi:hypothetical protein
MMSVLQQSRRLILRLFPFLRPVRRLQRRLVESVAARVRRWKQDVPRLVESAIRETRHLVRRTFPALVYREIGQAALRHLQATFAAPARKARHPDALRLVIVNHFYELDINAFLKADFDCQIHVLDQTHVGGIRRFFDPEPGIEVDHNSPPIRKVYLRARRYFASAGVDHILATGRPDVVLAPSDIFYWFRPFIEEFQARGVPVAVQDKEGTITPGPLVEEMMAKLIRNIPPLADRYYHWGQVQYESWTRGGLDPGKIRILGMPRSDFFYHPERYARRVDLGLPDDKRLVTCFTYEANVYLTTDVSGRNLGRPWLKMRQQMHAALIRLARLRPDIHIVVKCHPQCLEIDEIRAELAGAPNNVTILTGNTTGANLIVHSSVVIGFQTTALMETMLTAAPIVYTGWVEEHERYLPWLIPLALSGACYLPGSAEEMVSWALDLLDGRMHMTPEMLACRTAFASRYFADTRGHACERILRDIAETLSPRRIPPLPGRTEERQAA